MNTSAKRAKCCSLFYFFFDNFALYQNKRVAIIELRNEDEENVIIYS